jgi:uncharacterized GH25 family protein
MSKYLIVVLLVAGGRAFAHDTWVETNTNLVRMGDAVYVDLMLGNHGNDHRDFKLASKVELKHCTLDVVAPDGAVYDVKDKLVDLGYAPNEGFWKAKIATATPGVYVVSHTLDQVVHYAPVRAVKSAKTFFIAGRSLDHVEKDLAGFDKPLGHALEVVPTANPVAPMGPGKEIAVRVLYKGKPFANTKVSFIPRGHELQAGTDPDYERVTDAGGEARFTPKSGNTYLVVVHHAEPKESGEGYESTKYSATLTVFVPELCTCCVE